MVHVLMIDVLPRARDWPVAEVPCGAVVAALVFSLRLEPDLLSGLNHHLRCRRRGFAAHEAATRSRDGCDVMSGLQCVGSHDLQIGASPRRLRVGMGRLALSAVQLDDDGSRRVGGLEPHAALLAQIPAGLRLRLRLFLLLLLLRLFVRFFAPRFVFDSPLCEKKFEL